MKPGRPTNRTDIIRLVLAQAPVSRSDLADATGLSKVAVANITAELIREGWLEEEGRTNGVLGRPAALLGLNAQAGTVAGLDIQQGSVRLMTTDLRGRQAQVSEAPVIRGPAVWKQAEPEAGCPDATTPDATTVAQALLAQARREARHGPLRSAVVAVPAPVDAQGRLQAPSNLPGITVARLNAWSGTEPLLAFENDVKLAAVAEQTSGAASHTGNFALLAERRTGVAVGLVLGGQLFRGDTGRSGELALVRWPHDGRLTPLEDLPGAVRESALVQLVSGLTVVLDLQTLIVTQAMHDHGGPASDDPASDDPAPDDLVTRLRTLLPGTVDVQFSRHGDDGPLLGAALLARRLALDRLLGRPLTPPAPAGAAANSS